MEAAAAILKKGGMKFEVSSQSISGVAVGTHSYKEGYSVTLDINNGDRTENYRKGEQLSLYKRIAIITSMHNLEVPISWRQKSTWQYRKEYNPSSLQSTMLFK